MWSINIFHFLHILSQEGKIIFEATVFYGLDFKLRQYVSSRNSSSKRVARFEEELALLKTLPNKKYYAPLILDTTVSRFSTIQLLKVTYSVPSRLIGYKLRAYVYHGEIKLMYGQTVVQTFTTHQTHNWDSRIN
jgi:hypothetical protein